MDNNCDLWRAYESGLETTTSFGSNANSTPDGLVPYRKHNFKKSHLNNLDNDESYHHERRIAKKKMKEKQRLMNSESSYRAESNQSRHNTHSPAKSPVIGETGGSKNDLKEARSHENAENSADSQTSTEGQPQRIWKIELRREDMQLFDETEAKLFRKLLRKLVRNNGSTVSAVDTTPQQTAANQKSKSNNESLQSSSQRKTKRRKRKIITRRDKNGVIIEKIYKPYEGEEDKDDVIVKYENGQPVASYTASQLSSVKHQAGSDAVKFHKLTNGSLDSFGPITSNTVLSNNIQSVHTSQPDSSNALDCRDSASVDSSSETSSTKYPRRKRKNIYDESELNLPKPKYVAPLLNLSSVLAPVTETFEKKAEQNQTNSAEVLTNYSTSLPIEKEPTESLSDPCNLHQKPTNSAPEAVLKLQSSQPVRSQLVTSKVIESPVNEVSTHINHTFSKPDVSLTVEPPDRNEHMLSKDGKPRDPSSVPTTIPAKFSARTKFVTTKKESGTFVDFDYFDRSSHSHGSSRLIQFLSDGGITKKGDIVDPYDCCEMLETVLKLKRYKDELSESSSDESCADPKPEPENLGKPFSDNNQSNQKVSVKLKGKEGNSLNEETSKKHLAEAKGKTKTKSKKLSRKNKNGFGKFDSDDENVKSIVDKISRRYKTDKDDKTTSGQGLPHLKLPKTADEDEQDNRFSLINPGEDKLTQTLQYEQTNTLQLSNETVLELLRNCSGTNNNFCALCREPPGNELGPLYGPYIFSPPSSSHFSNGVTENSSRYFPETKTTVPINSSNIGPNKEGRTSTCNHCGSGSVSSSSTRQPGDGNQNCGDARGPEQGQIFLHGKCLLWTPVTCLVASQLLSLEQTLEAVVESVGPQFSYDPQSIQMGLLIISDFYVAHHQNAPLSFQHLETFNST